MTRYIEHKHGLVVGSDNIFSFRAADDKMSANWRSIVWAKGYTFDNYSTLHVDIKTPAETILWVQNDDDTIRMSRIVSGYLENQIGAKGVEWDYRPHPEDTQDAIFFRTRKNAMVLVNFIKHHLTGMKYL